MTAPLSERTPTGRTQTERTRTELGPGPELSLCAVTMAAGVALTRLFSDSTLLGPALLAAATVHLVAWACRRANLNLVVSAAISAAALGLFVSIVIEPHTTAFLIPTGGTWDAIKTELADAYERFGTVVAPVRPERGFILAALLGVWAAGFLADWAAFRARATFEALVPSFTLFVFAAVLAAERQGRLLIAAIYLAAVLGFLLVHNAARRAEQSSWFASRVHGGPQAILRAGAGLGTLALILAIVIGPLLPGARAEALLDWRDRDNNESGSRVTLSPLVDIRGRLVTQSDVEVFTVKSPVRAYWRLTALDSFDGATWGSKGEYRDAKTKLPVAGPSGGESKNTIQEFRIGALSSIWLPAAFRPERFAGPKGTSYDPASASLLADGATSDALTYQVESALPRLTGDELGVVPGEVPDDIADRFLSLPNTFSPRAIALARQLTEAAPTPYGKALALQNFFRDNFTYDLNVAPGHGARAVQRFLFVDRRGYCEQFAGTYAAMARAVGLPSRVGVGFTPGEIGEDGLFHVSGRNAHAWPEVWLAGYGWVAFEPTPGRGAPGAEAYTGIPEQQEAAGTGPAVGTATTLPAPAEETTPTTAGGAAPPRDEETVEAGGDPTLEPQAASPWGGRVRRTAVVLAAAALLWLVVVPLAHVVRGRRRRAGASGPTERTLLAWDDATTALAFAGYPRRPAETPAEYARRVTPAAALVPDLLPALAKDVAAAAYAPAAVADDVADRAELAAASVRSVVHDRTSWRRRLLRLEDPRELFSAAGARSRRKSPAGAGGRRS